MQYVSEVFLLRINQITSSSWWIVWVLFCWRWNPWINFRLTVVSVFFYIGRYSEQGNKMPKCSSTVSASLGTCFFKGFLFFFKKLIYLLENRNFLKKKWSFQINPKNIFFSEKKGKRERRRYEKPNAEGCTWSQMQFPWDQKKGGDLYHYGQLANHANW